MNAAATIAAVVLVDAPAGRGGASGVTTGAASTGMARGELRPLDAPTARMSSTELFGFAPGLAPTDAAGASFREESCWSVASENSTEFSLR